MSKSIESTIVIVATRLHEDWREGFEKSKGVGAKRPKKTKDTAWIAANLNSPYFSAATGEVNINIDYHLLPEDWKADNKDAASFVVPEVAKVLGDRQTLNQEEIEALADLVHQAWMRRQEDKEGKPIHEIDWIVQAGQHRDYRDLPEVEKEKDRRHVLLAVQALTGN